MVIREVGAHLLWRASHDACPDGNPAFPNPRSDRFTITSLTRLTHSFAASAPMVSMSHVVDLSRLRSRAAAPWRSTLPLRLIRLPVRDKRPGRASHLVGQRHHRHVERPASQQFFEPCGLDPHMRDHRTRTVDEQCPQVRVPPLAQVSDARLAACSAVRWNQSQAGRELASRAPATGITQRGGNRRRADRCCARGP